MAEPTDAEKAAAAQKTAFKALFKESLSEFLEENKEKQRTTGREVDTPEKSKSIFEMLGF